jgi:MarC family membrane protein
MSAAIVLFLVMDPFGNIPFFLSVLKDIPFDKQEKTILRELVIALLVLVLFLFVGQYLLLALHVSELSLHIAGGIILFLIALRLIFGKSQDIFEGNPEGEPLIVPLAIPSIAGPSAIATVLLLAAQHPDRRLKWLLALFLAWLASGAILMLCVRINRLLGERGLSALQRLTGLILSVIAVDMLVQGARKFLEPFF